MLSAPSRQKSGLPNLTRNAAQLPAVACIPGLLFAFVNDNLFELESLDDCWRKAPFSSKHVVELSTVDPRPPRPGRLTSRPIDNFV
jgi:hypothetical protein